MALPKQLRLRITKQNLFMVRKEGKILHSPMLKAFYLPSRTGGQQRGFSVIIGTSIAKKATVRNRLRRYIHEGILKFLPSLPEVVMIIYPKKEIVSKDKEVVAKDIALLLAKIGPV